LWRDDARMPRDLTDAELATAATAPSLMESGPTGQSRRIEPIAA